MSNPWSAPKTNPLAKLVEFIRIQIAGAPAERVEEAVKAIEEHVEAVIAPVMTRVEALEGRLSGAVAPVAAEAPDLFAEIREEIAALRARFEQIQPAPAADVSGDLKALHDRIVALESAKPAAPARAAAPAAPAARPAATTA